MILRTVAILTTLLVLIAVGTLLAMTYRGLRRIWYRWRARRWAAAEYAKRERVPGAILPFGERR